MRRLFRALPFLGLTATAAAHPQFSPTGQNRYLKVTLVGKGEIRLAYTLMVGEVPALRARKGADANGNGRVDPSEQQAAANALREAVNRGLTVEVDGTRRPIRWEPPTPGFSTDTQVGPIPFSIDLVGRVAAGGGEHRIHLDDTTPIEELGETEIRLEEGPGVDLIAAWQGREDNGRQVRFLFQGPKFSLLEDRSVGFRFIDHTVRLRPRSLPVALMGAVISAISALSVIVWFRRREMRRRKAIRSEE
ncbi:MAG TPA: hypothetical protein VH877_17465 [Polyangia bacterium]|jgi:hypothetical protein|nr:hypothetical protein [Polyangia bacterium]